MAGVAFLDAMAPRAYSGGPGDLAGLGGTEATLVRFFDREAKEAAGWI